MGAASITSLSQNTLTINGSYTQDCMLKLQIAFSGTHLKPDKYKPMIYRRHAGVCPHTAEGSLLLQGRHSLGSLKDHTNKFETILPKSNNVPEILPSYHHVSQTLSTALRADAFKPSGDFYDGRDIERYFSKS